MSPDNIVSQPALCVKPDEAARTFAEDVATDYASATGFTPDIYICAAANGAEMVVEGTRDNPAGDPLRTSYGSG